MEIPVGELEVIIYVPVRCAKHQWNLSVRPVTECPYYRCVKENDEAVYADYMSLWAKRTPGVIAQYPYGQFRELVEEITIDGGYVSEKASGEPMRIYKGTKWLEDGHHRAAIICALFGPNVRIPVTEVDKPRPNDIDQCSNPCP